MFERVCVYSYVLYNAVERHQCTQHNESGCVCVTVCVRVCVCVCVREIEYVYICMF